MQREYRGHSRDVVDPSAERRTIALERAFERAELNKTELLQSQEMLNGEAFGQLLGLSRATIDNRRVEGKLLALEFGAKRGFRYPRWQRKLLEERDTRAAFEAVLTALKPVSAWSRYRFLTQVAPALAGRTPLEALIARESDRVLAAATSWARGEQGGA
jgi:hypothetical protein